MRRPAPVDDDGSGPPLPQVESPFPERRQKRIAVVALAPCRKGGRPQVVQRDPGALLDEALGRGQAGHGALGLRRPGGLHPIRDVIAAALAQGPDDGPGMLRRRGAGHAELMLDDTGHALSPGEIEPDVDDPPVRADEGIDPVLVTPAVFDMDRPAHGLRPQSKLLLEQLPEAAACPVVVRDLKVGIRMHVVDRAVGAAAEAHRDELANLADKIRGAKAPGGDDLDAFVLGFE